MLAPLKPADWPPKLGAAVTLLEAGEIAEALAAAKAGLEARLDASPDAERLNMFPP